MDGRSSLTILFEPPFWVGLFQRWDTEVYSVCKVTFGAEPRDFEVYDFLLTHWRSLPFTSPTAAKPAPERRINPKRQQRAIHDQLKQRGIGTKAQQALNRQREENKQARQTRSKAQREAEQALRYALRQEKRKEKHRGH